MASASPAAAQRYVFRMNPVAHVTIGVVAVHAVERAVLQGRDGARSIDYRLAALGSLVPDLIDKPLARLNFPGYETYQTASHSYGHTLLLPLCIIIVGLLLARKSRLWMLVMGIGCLTHPLVDPVNTYPETLFWPLLGTDFPYANQEWRRYAQFPIDAALVTIFAVAVWRSEWWRQRAIAFIKRGEFPFERRADERTIAT